MVVDRPGCSPHIQCHSVPDTKRYERRRRAEDGCFQCEPILMRKTRAGVKQKTGNRQKWRNRHSGEREIRKKKIGGGDKNFQNSKVPEGYYSWCGEHTALAQFR